MKGGWLLALGLGVWAPSASAVGLAHGPAGDPAAWFGPDAYPPAAVRRSAQGRTVATLAIDAAGRVTGCSVAVSSGDGDLDATTCRIARSRGHFTPAMDDRGTAIASTYRLPVRWVLPDVASGPAIPPDRDDRPRPHHAGFWWRLNEAHHLIGFGAVVIAFLTSRLRRLLGWSRLREDGSELRGDQPFVFRRRSRWRSGPLGRVVRVAKVVVPVALVAALLGWLGW